MGRGGVRYGDLQRRTTSFTGVLMLTMEKNILAVLVCRKGLASASSCLAR